LDSREHRRPADWFPFCESLWYITDDTVVFPAPQRRSDRISIELPIEVIGYDADGARFVENGHTLLISRHGGMIVLKRKLLPEAQLTLVNMQLKDVAEVRVVGHFKARPDGEVYGVALLDEEKNLWQVNFPSLDRADNAFARVLLQCSTCHSQEVVHFTEMDMEVFTASQELIRSCKLCSAATVWKQLGVGTGPTVPVGEAESESKQEQMWKDKRRHPRKRVKLVACIRHSGNERIVQCEDVSQGGFSFISMWSYAVENEVEAAMPYSRAGGNIFLPARVAHCKERSTGWYKCGVAYQRQP